MSEAQVEAFKKPFGANLFTATVSVLLMDIILYFIAFIILTKVRFPDPFDDWSHFLLIRPGIMQFSYKLILLRVARNQDDRDLFRALWISIFVVFLYSLLILLAFEQG